MQNNKNIINIYRHITTNTGDMYSSPCLYFDWLKNAEKIDIYMEKVSEVITNVDKKVLILGGGGLITNKDFKKSLDWIGKSRFKKKIVWGAGHNTHDQNEFRNSDPFLEMFDLVGIRDFGTKYEWVPCASCMHEAFNKIYPIKNEIVVYEHKNFPLMITSYPKRNNKSGDLAETLSFLGSGKTVITNTYHGVYWTTLLQRKVILIEPFSTKFNSFKHSPAISNRKNFKDYLNTAKIYPNALSECRKANMNFALKVKRMLRDSL